jgi:hypothetical protein
MARKSAEAAFNEPWDPVEMGLPSLRDTVKEPMDLNTVKARYTQGYYSSGNVGPGCVHVPRCWWSRVLVALSAVLPCAGALPFHFKNAWFCSCVDVLGYSCVCGTGNGKAVVVAKLTTR